MDPVLLTFPTTPTVKTFAEIYCERHRCNVQQFRRRVFWRTLHRHAVFVAPVLLLGSHFVADEELIAACGMVRSMHAIREEIEDHRYHPLNRGWLRSMFAVRVSTHRLRRLAREYLSGPSTSPFRT